MKKLLLIILSLIACTNFAAAQNYLTLTAEEAKSNFYIAFKGYESGEEPNLQYSTDKVNWKNLKSNEWVYLTNIGDKVYLRGKNSKGLSFSNDTYTNIRISGKVVASGSVMSLIDNNGSSTQMVGTFQNLFSGSQGLTKAPELPATTLTNQCYYAMFSNCHSLISGPALPATTMKDSCYAYMFDACDALTTTPKLPATKLAPYCYAQMFGNCTALTSASDLPSNVVEDYSYYCMFGNCKNLKAAPNFQFSYVGKYSCFGMFSYCNQLQTAPTTMPAIKMKPYCYAMMYYGTQVAKVPSELPAIELAEGCYQRMYQSNTAITTAPKLPAMDMKQYCYDRMFDGCSNLTTAADLPANALTTDCYNSMYRSTNITQLKVGFTNWNSYSKDFLSSITTSGTLYGPQALSSEAKDNIPTKWTFSSSAYVYVANAILRKYISVTPAVFTNGTNTLIKLYYKGRPGYKTKITATASGTVLWESSESESLTKKLLCKQIPLFVSYFHGPAISAGA